MFRKRVVNKRKDKKIFSRTAGMVDKKNLRSSVMRGGYKL